MERAGDYDVLVLPEVQRLSAAEGERLAEFVRAGGRLVFTGNSGRLDIDGSSHEKPLLQALRASPAAGSIAGRMGGGMYIPDGPWTPVTVPIKGLPQEMPIFSQACRRYLRSTVSVGAGTVRRPAPAGHRCPLVCAGAGMVPTGCGRGGHSLDQLPAG